MDDLVSAIEAVYQRRYSGFRHGAAAILGDYDAAHDAVQDGFARALTHGARFRGGSLEAWIWRIVQRNALDRRRPRRGGALLETVDPALVSSDRDPELAAAVRRLPPRRRLVVFLRYYADLPYDEIARICGVSEGTVAATLSRAHVDLRGVLEIEGASR